MDLHKKLISIGKDLLKQFGMILLFFIIPSLLKSFFKKDINGNFNIQYFTIYIVIITIFLILYRKRVVPDFYDFKKNGKKYLKETWHYYIIGFALMFFTNAIIGLFLGLPENEITVRKLFSENQILYSIIIMLLGPIIEEIMTRAPLKNTFKNKIIYYILSALIFGLLHITNYIDGNNILELLHILPYASLGFVFAIIYDKSNNIWTSIMYHSIHNTLAIIILIIFGGLI